MRYYTRPRRTGAPVANGNDENAVAPHLPMKILVIKRDKIGDLLLTTPMIAHLRQSLPQAEVHVLANDYNAWVIAGNNDVDRVWIYRRVRTGNRISPAAALGIIWQNVQLRRE